VELGFLSPQGLAELLVLQEQRNHSLGDILVGMGAIDRATLLAEESRCTCSAEDGNPGM
jgi:hypothetical protein